MNLDRLKNPLFITRYRSLVTLLEPRWVVAAVLVPLFAFLILTQSPFVVIGGIGAIAAFVLILRRPELGLYFMLLAIPVQDKVNLGAGGTQLTMVQGATFLTLFAWWCNRGMTRQPILAKPLPVLIPFFLLYMGVMLASLTIATDLMATLNETFRWFVAFFVYVMATGLIKTRKQLWWLVGALVAGGLVEAVIGILQTGFKVGPASFAIGADLSRAFGTFNFPNPYAGYLEMSAPIWLALVLHFWAERGRVTGEWLTTSGEAHLLARKKLIRTYFWLVGSGFAFLLIALAIIASYSRGAWLGCVFALLMMILVRGKKGIPYLLIGVALPVLLVLAVQTGVVSEQSAERLFSITEQFTPFDVRDVVATPENYAVVERMAMWQAGGTMFLSNMLQGVGAGNFDATYQNFRAPLWYYSRGHAHNYYIHAAAETGLIGLTVYLVLVITAFVYAWNTVRRTKDYKLHAIAWGAFGCFMAVTSHNLVENLHVYNMTMQWAGILALFYLVRRLDNVYERENSL
jgi:O-antigen ligase